MSCDEVHRTVPDQALTLWYGRVCVKLCVYKGGISICTCTLHTRLYYATESSVSRQSWGSSVSVTQQVAFDVHHVRNLDVHSQALHM